MANDILANLCKYMKETNLNDLKQNSKEDKDNDHVVDTELVSNINDNSDVDITSENDIICDECGGNISLQNDELLCSGCGVIRISDNSIINDSSSDSDRVTTYRIKIVGKDGGQFQHDLDRAAPINETAIRKASILAELQTLNCNFVNKNCNAMLGDALDLAANYYNQMQNHYIKRGANKKMILTALIYKACLECGYHRDKVDIAKFVELPTNAISKGDAIVRKAVAEGKIDMKLMDDTSHPHIETTFVKIKDIIDETCAMKYKKATSQIITISEKHGICANNQMKSKVAAIIVFIMQKINKNDIATKIMSKIDVRNNTIKKIVNELDEYQEYFQSVIDSIID